MTVDANKPLHLNNEIPEEDFKKAFDNTVGSGRLWVRDGFGSVDPVQVLNDIRFLVQHHGVQWVILDHLSILMSGLELDDERKCIDRTMTMLRSFCEETQVGMILVSHLRRSQGDKGPEDGSHISLQMLRGSHSIAQLSDQVISLVRNISSGDNTAELVVLKNRFTGETGPAGTLSYNKETGRLKESTIEELFTADSYDDF
jgi:twinkle protein